MSIESYKSGMMYEVFMSRAFQTHDTTKPGIGLSNMRNLIDAENGEGFVNHLPSADKQLIKVKNYIDKAFDKLIKRRKTEDKRQSLIVLQEQAQSASSSSALLDIIEQAIELTQDLK